MSDVVTDGGSQWREVFERSGISEALQPNEHGVIGLWTPIGKAAESATGDEKIVLEALAKIASLYVRPDDWNTPYGPAMVFGDRRSALHTDLTPDEIAMLADAASAIPHAGLRARVYDILSLTAIGALRVQYAGASVDSLLADHTDGESWMTERDAWDRSLTVVRRYGAAMRARKAKLEQVLRRIVRTSSDGYAPLQAAELLAKHHLAGDRASIIGSQLRRIGKKFQGEQKRAYLQGAASWMSRGGDNDLAAQIMVDEVQDLIEEAELLATDDQNAARSAHLYEEALQRVRGVPRLQRERLGVVELPRLLAQRIRELGTLSIGSMHAFETDPIDLTSVARDARDRIKDRPVEEALKAYASLGSWLAIDQEVERAKALLAEHPLQAMFSNVHFSTDGRVIYRSGGRGGTSIYGIDPVVWDMVMRTYEMRINLMAQGALWPAWVQLTIEHRLSGADFAAMIAHTGVVPADHTAQFARALYYGYNGDFSTAMQLLAPQIENLVRFHMANAGESTSAIGEGQIESEIGLSSLMEREVVEQIFTRDLAFEIRALFCGPIGPNIRNDTAHGLISDHSASGTTALYCWWFALRLVFMLFWNSIHDVDAAEAREPRAPGEFRK